MTTLDAHSQPQPDLDMFGGFQLMTALGNFVSNKIPTPRGWFPLAAVSTGCNILSALVGPWTVHYGDFFDPAVVSWSNVAFHDNYYQELNKSILPLPNIVDTLTVNGEDIATADLSIPLHVNFVPGFITDSRTYSPHRLLLEWYAGTINLSDEFIGSDFVYRKLGDGRHPQFSEDIEILSKLSQLDRLNPWYTPERMKSGQTSDETPTEGIGTGWCF